MNKRDLARLDGLLLMLTAHFADPAVQSITIFRGDARAIAALIRDHNKTAAEIGARAALPKEPT